MHSFDEALWNDLAAMEINAGEGEGWRRARAHRSAVQVHVGAEHEHGAARDHGLREGE